MSTIKEWRQNLKYIVNQKYTANDIPQLLEILTTVATSITLAYERKLDGRTIRSIENDYDKLKSIIYNLEHPIILKVHEYSILAEVDVLFVPNGFDVTNPTYEKWEKERKTGDGSRGTYNIAIKYTSENPNLRTPTRRDDQVAINILEYIKDNAVELRILNEDSAYKIYLIRYTPVDRNGNDRIKTLMIRRPEETPDYNLYTKIRLHGQILQYEGIKEEKTDEECGKVLLEYSGLSTTGINLDNGISLEELEQFIHYTQTPAIIVNLFDEPIIKFRKGDPINPDFSKIKPLLNNYRPTSKPKMMVAKVANGHLYNITDEKQRHKYQHPDYKKPAHNDTRKITTLEECDEKDCDCMARLDLSKMKGVYSTKCSLAPLYHKCLNNNYIPKIYETNIIQQIQVNGITIYHDSKREISKQLLSIYDEIYGTNTPYINQSFMSILKMFLPSFKSIQNEQTAQIFENNISSGGFYFQEEHKNLFGLDINAAYPTIMKNNVLPVFDGSETIQPFTGTINERSLYYINPKSNNLMCQPGYFYGCAVQEFINSNFLTTQEILDEINPNSSTNEICNLMETFETKIHNKQLLKEIRCNMSGLLGQLDVQTKIARTTSLFDVYSLKNTTYTIDGFINNFEITLTNTNNITTTLVKYHIPVYKVIREDRTTKTESSRPAYVYIIHKNYANVLKLRQWILTIPEAHITGIKTDAIYFTSKQINSEIGPVSEYQPSKAEADPLKATVLSEDGPFKYIGTPKGTKWINGTTAIKKEAKHHYQAYKRITPSQTIIEQVDNRNPIDLQKYKNGFHIDSLPGTGKTAILKQLAAIYTNSKTITFTNAVAHNIGGQTLHKFFNQKVNNMNYNTPFKCPPIILIDECYNLPAEFYPLIAKMKAKGTIIYSFGDSEQLESIDKKRMTQDEKKLFWSRMSPINLILMHNWRSNNEYVEQARQGLIVPPLTDKTSLINICKYNSSREVINQNLFNLYGYKRFVVVRNNKKENLFKGQIYELQDDKITLLYRGPTSPRKFKPSYLKYIEPGYAITNHIAQGSSINEPYTIVDFDKMNQRARFVALTRTTDPSLITTAAALPRDKRQPKKTWKDNKYI